MERRLGLGVVGINPRIRRAILAGIVASSRGRLVAVCSRSPEKAAEAAREFGGTPYFSFRTMLNDRDVEAVVVCTPHGFHPAMAIDALRAGKLVICEKPMGLTVTDAAAMCDVAEVSGLPTVVNFTYHSLPGHRFVARLLSEGVIGNAKHLDLSYWQARQGLAEAGMSDAIVDLGSHLLDLATWWSNEAGAGDIRSIVGHDDGGTERGVRIWGALARTGTGTLITIQADRLAAGWRNGMIGRLVGEAGCLTLTFDTDAVEVQLARFGDGSAEGIARVLPIPADLAVGYQEFPAFHVDRLIAGLRGEIVFPDFAYGLRCQRLIEASIESSQTKQWVSLVPQSPR